MIVDRGGGQVGTLGGGCVEAEVKQKALRQADTAGATLHTFVLDHDYAWADGLICGGKMVISSETLRDPGALEYYRTYRALLEAGDGFTEVVVLDPLRLDPERENLPTGARFLFGPCGELRAGWPEARPPASLVRSLTPLSERPRPSAQDGVALFSTLPRVRLVIVGGGHVGQGVASLAAQADFDVWVVDDREQFASRERFPHAERRIVGPLDQVLPALDVTPHTYILIVTRGHGHDQEALYYLAPTIAPYVGLIGSKRKIKLIFDSLREAGLSDLVLDRVTAPVGLDIGSQTVPEIAISIVAELIARRNLGPGKIVPSTHVEAQGSRKPSIAKPVPVVAPAAG
ncbi:MAG: hypothetical protein NVSMB9_02140 [Isosphaeraceae bacterium]